MSQQENMPGETCPVARTLDVIGDRWSWLIVRDAFDGIRRFGEFQKIWAWRAIFWPRACAP